MTLPKRGIERSVVADFTQEPMEDLLSSFCQHVIVAEGATEVCLIKLEVVATWLDFSLSFQEIMYDLEPGLLRGTPGHCMSACAAQPVLDLLDHGFGVVALFAVTALDSGAEGRPLASGCARNCSSRPFVCWRRGTLFFSSWISFL